MSHSVHHPAGAARRRVAAACAVLLLGITGCSITTPTARSDAERDLQRNRQRWAGAGIRDYEFDFRRICFCLTEVTERVHIVVRNDVVTSVVRVRDGQPASTAVGAWPRVNDLFDEIQRRIDEGAERLDVTYDPALGYPRTVAADVILMAADDEYWLTAENLQRLP